MKAKRPRPVPQRTCVGCRQVLAKRALVRIVRTPEGEVVVDPTGRRNGRGAYVHQARECWELALKRGGIERALKVNLSPEVRKVLEEYVCSLPPSPPRETQSEQGLESDNAAAGR